MTLLFEMTKAGSLKAIRNDALGQVEVMRMMAKQRGRNLVGRDQMRDFGTARSIALQASSYSGKLHLACHIGTGRFDVIRAPRVGDRAKLAFGDGTFERIGTVSYVTGGSAAVVRTSNGMEFRRRGDTDVWRKPGGERLIFGAS